MQVHLDTSHGRLPSQTPSDCVFEIVVGASVMESSFYLNRAIIPNLRYSVHEDANTLTIDDDGTPAAITLTPGNYTATTLAIELEGELIIATGNASLTVTFSAITYKLTIDTNTAALIGITGGTALDIVGFSGLEASATDITGSYPIRLDSTKYVDVCVAGLRSDCVTSLRNQYAVIARVPMLQNYGNIIFYEPTRSDSTFFFNLKDLYNIHVYLLDDQRQLFKLPSNAHCVYELVAVQKPRIGVNIPATGPVDKVTFGEKRRRA